jgi:hypothetical protein
MKREILFVQKIAEQADTFYGDGKSFGEWAFRAFGKDRTQMKKLEGIANSTLKVSDVLDYIKKQTGKQKPGEKWRNRNDNRQEFGQQLIIFISGTLESKRNTVCSLVTSALEQAAITQEVTASERQQTYLALIRDFVRQAAAQYELEVSNHDT